MEGEGRSWEVSHSLFLTNLTWSVLSAAGKTAFSPPALFVRPGHDLDQEFDMSLEQAKLDPPPFAFPFLGI